MKPHILIVDDDSINAEMISMRLEKRDFKVTIISSGRKAIDYCLEFCQKDKIHPNRPDIVMLDILMPDMDGLEVLKELRQTFSQIELPIIMATAKSETHDLVHTLNLGANDFIHKPINIDIAGARLKTQILALKGHREEMERQELEAISAMITTYNHEINNPLTVAFGFIWKLKKEYKPEYLTHIEISLNRIVSIVKKIDSLTTDVREKEKYAKSEKFYKVK